MAEAWSLRVEEDVRGSYRVQRLNDSSATRVVSLGMASCSCCYFAEFGVPCRHICAAAVSVGIHPRLIVVPELRIEKLQAAYSGKTTMVDLNGLEDDGLQPPTCTKRRGRPKEKRIPSSAEKGPKKSVTCGKCGKRGHNSRTCKSSVN